jgi:UDP-glucose 4-epimerase
MFKNKTILITGGTGSFGKTILNYFLNKKIKEIRIFSRDEKKQDDIRKKYNEKKIKFYIGDVRDYNSINNAMKDCDYVFHAAALKQVPSCEFYPMEAVKTNILGTENVLDSAINSNVKKVIVLSTDKAVYPINAMGISKAMMEKVSIQKSLTNKNTIINIVRYGNVIASRGSIVPLFVDQINNKKPLTVTDPNMTRFMMTLQDAVNLVLYAFKFGKPGEIFVQKAPSTDLKTLAEAVKNLFQSPKHPVNIIGTRHGEKLFEVLLSREEMSRSRELKKYYSISPDLRDLNYEKFVEVGEKKISLSKEYNSHNTNHLNMKQTQKLLMQSNYIKKSIKGIYSQSED